MENDSQSRSITKWRAAATAYLEALTGLNVFCLQHELPVDGDMQQILHNQGIVYNPTRTAETLAPEAQTQLQALQHTAEQRKQALGTLAIFAPEPGAEKEIKRLADTTAIEVRFGLQSMPRRSWSQAVHSTISRAPADTGRGNG